jgi:hypothetical protein
MGTGPGRKSCPLCDVYNNDASDITSDNCRGCPVKACTGFKYCTATPFPKASQAWQEWIKNPGFTTTVDYLTACEEEVGFLKSLLPKGEEGK